MNRDDMRIVKSVTIMEKMIDEVRHGRWQPSFFKVESGEWWYPEGALAERLTEDLLCHLERLRDEGKNSVEKDNPNFRWIY